MRIELLTTGTELLLGTTQNTHGAWLGQELFKRGLRIQRQVTVPDGEAVALAMADAVEAADVLIVTGGLGPTSDDLTREAIAEVLGVELIEDEQALRTLRSFFEQRGRVMAEANRKQAMAPVGADILPNPNGTAPGLYLPPRVSGERNCAVFLLPGPPSELYPMVLAEVFPRLEALFGIEELVAMRELRFVGIGESDFHEGVDEALHAVEGLEFGYCARLGEVDLRLVGSETAVAQGREIAVQQFAKQLVSEDGSSLEETVVRLLREQGKTVSTAESCTGGLIANRITDVPGSSEVFRYGYVTYANEAKRDLLGVRWDDLERHGAVSEAVARQMAEGALRSAGADVAVAVTGIAGPDGGSAEKPVGTVFLAVALRGGETRVVKQFHPRSRLSFKQAVSQSALDLVRRTVVRASSQQEVAAPSEGLVFRPFKEEGKTTGATAPSEGLVFRPFKKEGKTTGATAPSEGLVFRPFKKEGKTTGATAPSEGLVFRPFKEEAKTTKSKRRLPHWEQEGATQYVTFRLGDSIPQQAYDAWDRDRREWLAVRGVQVQEGGQACLDELTVAHRREYMQRYGQWFQDQLDRCEGECLLRDPENRDIVRSALQFFDGKRYSLGDFVIMPNHVHVLLVPFAGQGLGGIVKSWKQFATTQINARTGRQGTLWQAERFDHIVRSKQQLQRIRDYIRENPEKAKLREAEYTWEGREWDFE